MFAENTITFVPFAEPAEPHAACAECGAEWPTRNLHGIQNQDDANRVCGLLEVDADGDMCPECRDALIAEARAAVCRCGDRNCNGPVQVDVDRWECR